MEKRKNRFDYESLYLGIYCASLFVIRGLGWIDNQYCLFGGLTGSVLLFTFLHHQKAMQGIKFNFGPLSVDTTNKTDKQEDTK